MTTRYLIAAALMASACVAHADVLPGTTPPAAAGGSDALVQALYDKVSASVGSDMKVSLRQGTDGVYVTGLSTAKAAALAGDGMSVINTSEGFKVVQAMGANGMPVSVAGSPVGGGGAAQGNVQGGLGNGNASPTGNTNANANATGNPNATGGTGSTGSTGSGSGNDTGLGLGAGGAVGAGTGGLGNQAAATGTVPEPSTAFLMLAGMLGVLGLGRRRAR